MKWTPLTKASFLWWLVLHYLLPSTPQQMPKTLLPRAPWHWTRAEWVSMVLASGHITSGADWSGDWDVRRQKRKEPHSPFNLKRSYRGLPWWSRGWEGTATAGTQVHSLLWFTYWFTYLLGAPSSVQALSSLTKDWTWALCSDSTESYPQGSPGIPSPCSQKIPHAVGD